jgi:REP element-mobilizing transposase RayT
LKDNSKKHQRKSIRLSEYDYAFPNWYYITICIHERRNLFGKIKNGKMILNKIGNVVEEEWIRTKELRKYVDLDYYVIMPNHLHGIIIIEQSIEDVGATRRIEPTDLQGRGELNSPTRDGSGRIQYAPTENKFKSPSHSLGAIVRGFKSSVTKRLKEISGNSDLKIWQRNYYEHIIRNEIDLQNIRKYITLNPLKWEIDEYFNS